MTDYLPTTCAGCGATIAPGVGVYYCATCTAEQLAAAETEKEAFEDFHAFADAAARPGCVTVTRTRRSLAEQLREALDDLVATGGIVSWSSHYGENRPAYHIDASGPVKLWPDIHATVEYDFTPGEAMDFVNAHGYDVRIGKA